jgi:hypothetical protein
VIDEGTKRIEKGNEMGGRKATMTKAGDVEAAHTPPGVNTVATLPKKETDHEKRQGEESIKGSPGPGRGARVERQRSERPRLGEMAPAWARVRALEEAVVVAQLRGVVSIQAKEKKMKGEG